MEDEKAELEKEIEEIQKKLQVQYKRAENYRRLIIIEMEMEALITEKKKLLEELQELIKEQLREFEEQGY